MVRDFKQCNVHWIMEVAAPPETNMWPSEEVHAYLCNSDQLRIYIAYEYFLLIYRLDVGP